MTGEKSGEFRGKTVEAAISTGLAVLRLSREEIEVEIVRPGSRGVLGIGAEDAVVRLTSVHLTKTEPKPAPRPEPRPEPEALPSPPAPVARPEAAPDAGAQVSPQTARDPASGPPCIRRQGRSRRAERQRAVQGGYWNA